MCKACKEDEEGPCECEQQGKECDLFQNGADTDRGFLPMGIECKNCSCEIDEEKLPTENGGIY